jgi:Zn-dependent protease
MNGTRNARELFRLFGTPIRIDASWFLLAALIVWSLAVGAFPAHGRPDLLVVEHGRLLGSISIRDVLDYCTLGLELDA